MNYLSNKEIQEKLSLIKTNLNLRFIYPVYINKMIDIKDSESEQLGDISSFAMAGTSIKLPRPSQNSLLLTLVNFSAIRKRIIGNGSSIPSISRVNRHDGRNQDLLH